MYICKFIFKTDLSLENIIVCDGDFEINQDGSVTINSNIKIKLGDFGLSEVYEPYKYRDNFESFDMAKWGLKDSYTTTAPNVYKEEIYNGMKADIWSLGCILYQLSSGKHLYRIPDETVDPGFYCVQHGQLKVHLEINNLKKYFNNKTLSLIEGMLNIDESKRFSSIQVLQCEWFAAYYKRYHHKIEKKSKLQKVELVKQTPQMRYFPYYQQN